MSRARSNTNGESKRKERIPMGSATKLHAPEREGYRRYFTLSGPNHPGLIDQMLRAGYDFVLDGDGKKTEVPAGGGNMHVLMETPIEYYNEDMAAQEASNSGAMLKEINKLGDSEYIPEGREKVAKRDII